MIQIFRTDEQDEEFYAIMGPCFASLEIAKELERQVYNKPETDWHVIFNRFDNVIGFVSVHDAGKYYYIDNLWIEPGFRGRGYGLALINDACRVHANKPLKCIACNPYALRIFEKFGFVEVGTRGKYKRLEKH